MEKCRPSGDQSEAETSYTVFVNKNTVQEVFP